MTDLAAFLLARIAEDEESARVSASILLIIKLDQCRVIGSDEHLTYMHFDRHGPKRVLAECDAKRRIVERYSHLHEHGDSGDMRWVLPLLALPYADHPDYDPAWRP